VIGDLPAPVDIHRGYRVGDSRQMDAAAGDANGVNGRVLQNPELVGRVLVAAGGECLHGVPGGLVIDSAKITYLHSTITTAG